MTSIEENMREVLGVSNSKEVIIGEGRIRFGIVYRDLLHDQGICVRVYGDEAEILRFDCLDYAPHYHYDPAGKNERLEIDVTTAGDPLEWSITQLRTRLSQMIRRAGCKEFEAMAKSADLDEDIENLVSQSRKMSVRDRRTVLHDRGEVIVDVGSVKIGIEYRKLANDEGIALHVLGDENGEEIELLTFDCFKNAPHYHYGPRSKNQRLYLDRTVVPNPLIWAIHLLKGGKLAAMLERAGYKEHAQKLNPTVMVHGMAQVESISIEMEKANSS